MDPAWLGRGADVRRGRRGAAMTAGSPRGQEGSAVPIRAFRVTSACTLHILREGPSHSVSCKHVGP